MAGRRSLTSAILVSSTRPWIPEYLFSLSSLERNNNNNNNNKKLLPKLPADVHGLTDVQWIFPAICGFRELSTILGLWLEYIIRKLVTAAVCS
jgi:hypothetical protein